MKKIYLVLAILGFSSAIFPLKAVVILGSQTPNRYAPSGTSYDATYKYVGVFRFSTGNSMGTIIGPRSVITAAHVGGAPGDIFWDASQNMNLTTYSYVNAPTADLRIWYINFQPGQPDFGQQGRVINLWDGSSSEIGADTIVYGIEYWDENWAVYVSGVFKGFSSVATPIGPGYGAPTWGTSSPVSITAGDLIFEAFNPRLYNSCHLAPGDSGGGEIAHDGNGIWYLIGVNVRSGFNTTSYSGADYDPTWCGYMFLLNDAGLLGACGPPAVPPPGFNQTFDGIRIANNVSWIRANIQ